MPFDTFEEAEKYAQNKCTEHLTKHEEIMNTLFTRPAFSDHEDYQYKVYYQIEELNNVIL